MRHLDSSQFLRLLLLLKVFRSITLKYLHDSNAEYSDAAVNFFFNFIQIIYSERYIGTGLQLARLFEAGQAT